VARASPDRELAQAPALRGGRSGSGEAGRLGQALPSVQGAQARCRARFVPSFLRESVSVVLWLAVALLLVGLTLFVWGMR